jgi:hypothetical protein
MTTHHSSPLVARWFGAIHLSVVYVVRDIGVSLIADHQNRKRDAPMKLYELHRDKKQMNDGCFA